MHFPYGMYTVNKKQRKGVILMAESGITIEQVLSICQEKGLSVRKVLLKLLNDGLITKTERNRLELENTARNKGMTLQEYRKWKEMNAAEKRGMRLNEYKRLMNANTTKNKGLSFSEYNKLRHSGGLTQVSDSDIEKTVLKEYNNMCKGSTSDIQFDFVLKLSEKTGVKFRRVCTILADNSIINKKQYTRLGRELTAYNKGITLKEYNMSVSNPSILSEYTIERVIRLAGRNKLMVEDEIELLEKEGELNHQDANRLRLDYTRYKGISTTNELIQHQKEKEQKMLQKLAGLATAVEACFGEVTDMDIEYMHKRSGMGIDTIYNALKDKNLFKKV